MKKCIVCDSILHENPLLTLPNMPRTAQDLPDATQLATESGFDLNLCQCDMCGLVQLDCDPVPYFRDVIRAGGFTKTMVELRHQQYRHLIEDYQLQGRKFIEVGAGRGEFLSLLNEYNVQYAGIENSDKLVEIARENGLPISKGFVEDERTVIEGGPFDVFLSFNFLEHQPNPGGMLRGIFRNLSQVGMGLITVPSLEYIIENNSVYELIHDHIAYYTEETFRFVLEKNGFQVIECTRLNRDTLSAIVRKKSRMDVSGLENAKRSLKLELNSFIDPILEDGGRVAIWGASHQGLTVLSSMNLTSKITYVIDSAPFKQGKFTPSSHVEIVPPDRINKDPIQGIIVIAPGYSDEIIGIIKRQYDNTIKIAVLRSQSLEIVS